MWELGRCPIIGSDFLIVKYFDSSYCILRSWMTISLWICHPEFCNFIISNDYTLATRVLSPVHTERFLPTKLSIGCQRHLLVDFISAQRVLIYPPGGNINWQREIQVDIVHIPENIIMGRYECMTHSFFGWVFVLWHAVKYLMTWSWWWQIRSKVKFQVTQCKLQHFRTFLIIWVMNVKNLYICHTERQRYF